MNDRLRAMLRRWLPAVCVLAAAVSGGASLDAGSAAAETGPAFRDVAGHWASGTIAWGVERGVVNGFPGGVFLPDGQVTEAEFLAMLFRAYPEDRPAETAPYWYSAYYRKAAEWNWPVSAANARTPILRGTVARIVAASQGRQLPVDEAVAYILERGLAQGRLAADGSVDFGEGGTLTRAEAVQFVRNVAAGADIGAADKPPAAAETRRSDAAASVSDIAVGDSEASLLSAMGAPARKDASEYGFQWYVYNQDYANFSMFGVSNGLVVALYGNGSNVRLKQLDTEATAGDVRAALGDPIGYILKDNVRYLLDDDGEKETFETDRAYVTVFYDLHEDGVVSGVQAVGKTTEATLDGFYGVPDERLRESFERQSLDLANSARARFGLPAFAWHEGASETARAHSADMAERGYFSHVNLRGESPFDRLEDDGIRFAAAGENIAAGQASAIFAHEAWMNSTDGHREAILGDYEQFGAGVAFDEDDRPFYTQNFLTVE